MIYRSLIILIISFSLTSSVRPDKEFKIFQFPQNQIPRIDGEFTDWEMVPDAYNIGVYELENTVIGVGEKQNPNDFDLNVKVGWVKGLNRLYFYIDAYDDFWDFEDVEMGQDIFELVVDGDASGGQFINQKNYNFNNRLDDQPFFEGRGVNAQNYHIFLPAQNKDWAMPWGNHSWLKEFPYANAAYNYNFKQGQDGRLKMEFYVTAYDFSSFSGPEESIESSIKENDVIGISWAMLDFDGEACESFMNLSHDIKMIANASYLCRFRLMPLENFLLKPIEADWTYKMSNTMPNTIEFFDNSVGQITKWHWDFGDGTSSEDKNPVHTYTKTGIWTIVLTVESPSGSSSRSKVWEVSTVLKD